TIGNDNALGGIGQDGIVAFTDHFAGNVIVSGNSIGVATGTATAADIHVNGIQVGGEDAGVSIYDNDLANIGFNGIFAAGGGGTTIYGNRIDGAGNAGIAVQVYGGLISIAGNTLAHVAHTGID